jgi:mannose/fructose-specific phosphotransferase system component IIA
MLDAVERIAGVEAGALLPLSNEGKSPEALQAELSRLLQPGPAIIFTDLASGSCALSAQVCCRDNASHVVFFGTNLPVLLDFVFNRDLPLQELVPRLLERGKESLKSSIELPADAPRSISG